MPDSVELLGAGRAGYPRSFLDAARRLHLEAQAAVFLGQVFDHRALLRAREYPVWSQSLVLVALAFGGEVPERLVKHYGKFLVVRSSLALEVVAVVFGALGFKRDPVCEDWARLNGRLVIDGWFAAGVLEAVARVVGSWMLRQVDGDWR